MHSAQLHAMRYAEHKLMPVPKCSLMSLSWKYLIKDCKAIIIKKNLARLWAMIMASVINCWLIFLWFCKSRNYLNSYNVNLIVFRCFAVNHLSLDCFAKVIARKLAKLNLTRWYCWWVYFFLMLVLTRVRFMVTFVANVGEEMAPNLRFL
jgi:hypothetical protein